MNSTGHLAA
uniref:Uncharacterized protein n=1 Tax=Arundo donax TaxID=35708 RepID=A0A0A9A245_ARUDO